jgi:protein required for attachment to host cells
MGVNRHVAATVMTRRTNFDPRWARRGESLVVVADGGRARILRREGRRDASQLLELERFERSGAHRPARELDYDPHSVQIERFARHIAMRLAHIAQQLAVQELVLIAAPRFLGALRRELSEPLRHLVTREIARDLTGALPQPIARAAFSLPVSSTPAAASPG